MNDHLISIDPTLLAQLDPDSPASNLNQDTSSEPATNYRTQQFPFASFAGVIVFYFQGVPNNLDQMNSFGLAVRSRASKVRVLGSPSVAKEDRQIIKARLEPIVRSNQLHTQVWLSEIKAILTLYPQLTPLIPSIKERALSRAYTEQAFDAWQNATADYLVANPDFSLTAQPTTDRLDLAPDELADAIAALELL